MRILTLLSILFSSLFTLLPVSNNLTGNYSLLSDPIENEFIEITDYRFDHLNTTYSAVTETSDVGGNAIYYFNLPETITDDDYISEIEVTYEACATWFPSESLPWFCPGGFYEKTVVRLNTEELSLWNYKESTIVTKPIVMQVGKTADLQSISRTTGPMFSMYNGSTNMSYYLMKEYYVENSEFVSIADNYKYYFAMDDGKVYDSVVIRVQVVTHEGTIVDYDSNSQLGGDEKPPIDLTALFESLGGLEAMIAFITANWKYLVYGIVILLIIAFIGPVFSLIKLAFKGIVGGVKMLVDLIKGLGVAIVWLVKLPARIYRFLFQPKSRSIDQAWQRVKRG